MRMNVTKTSGVVSRCALSLLHALLFVGASGAFATNVHPTLPPVEFPDTEVVTNVAVTTSDKSSREYAFELVFTGSASNNVEIAFGTDADGDGVLSLGEIALSVGWDCGEWILFNAAAESRLCAVGGDGAHKLVGRIRMRADGLVRSMSVRDGDTPLFSELADSMPVWTFPTEWNVARLVGRGENVRTGERFHITTSMHGFAVQLH